MGEEAAWRPGPLARLRALIRRALLALLGGRGEERLHAAYHGVLRRTGRFAPPEDTTTLAMLGLVGERAMTLIDVGANVGLYSWFLRRCAKADAILFALEPHPGVARLLRRTLRGLAGSVVLEVAAADHDGTAQLVVPDGAFGTPVPGLGWVRTGGGHAGPAGISIGLRRLDSLVNDGTILVRDPVFIKIDVEGGEAAVLRGASELLRRHRPIIYLECQAALLARRDESPAAVWGQLEGAGYRLFGNRGHRFVWLSEAERDIVNYLAIPDLAGTTAVEELDPPAMAAIIDAWTAAPLPTVDPCSPSERESGAR